MNDPTRRVRLKATYAVMGGTAFLCFSLHTLLFWSVYFWLPASFLCLLLLGLVVKQSVRDSLLTLSLFALLWIFTTVIPLLMLCLGQDLYRGILR